jgi:chromosome segregation protein
LRGKTGEDVIFHGSQGHDAAKHAEVTLIFENKNNVLHYNDKTIKVTRRLTRGSGNNEYFINDEPCRLKDIQEIFLDTGLSKGSLGIISQGTVQWFVDAKPEERRTIFEEAAGIGLYIKKRDESNSQLERTNQNLDQVTIVVNELSTDIRKLERQAEKAKIYTEKKKELMNLDLTILVKDIQFYKSKLTTIITELEESKKELDVFQPDIKQITHSLEFSKQKVDEADKVIETLTSEMSELIDEINKHEMRKFSLQSKLTEDLSSDNLQKKIDAYSQLIESTKIEIANAQEALDKFKGEFETYEEVAKKITDKKNDLSDKISKHSIKLAEVKAQIRNIQNNISNRDYLDIGTKTIIDNAKNINGVIGQVKDYLNVNKEYEKAIYTVLGKMVNNIIVEDVSAAEKAINFLKQNQSGKATFLPLETIKPRLIKDEYLDVLKTIDGFIGIAAELVEYESKYTNVYKFLLGNVILADSIKAANNLSKYTYQLYRVVTLDGDLINVGGSMTGGHSSEGGHQGVNLEKQLEKLSDEFKTIDNELTTYRMELDQVLSEFNDITAKLNEKRIISSKYEEIVSFNQKQLFKFETDYEQLLSKHKIEKKKVIYSEQSLSEIISKLSIKKDKINEELVVARQSKTLHRTKVDDFEARLTELRFQIDKHRDIIANHETEKVRCESFLDNARDKITSNYKMTIEYAFKHYQGELPMSDTQAREIINKLQSEIDRLGSINMEAINELEEKQARFVDLEKQQKELQEARDNILKAISELDNKAKDDFTNVIKNVNETLPSVFKYLFGGGSCQIEYTNPEDVLVSGIDVIANPPGKNFVHLGLLSGGEKTLVALSILFSILKNRNFPLIILDEAESALDPANVERFGNIIRENSKTTQFITVTHRPGTMERCEILYGATMQTKGITSIFKVSLANAKEEFGSDKVE